MKVWVWLTVLGFVATSSVALAEGAGATVQVSTDATKYSALGVVEGDAPVFTAVVKDGQGAPIAGAEVRFVIVRQAPVVGFVGNETLYATTGVDGVATVTAGTASSLAGNYVVVAFAAGSGSNAARYSVSAI